MNTAIVTDSTADLPADLVERHSIHVVPTLVVIGGRAYQDGLEISREDFYRNLPEMATPPTTAAPSSGSFEALYEQLLAQGVKEIISIHASHTLSGIYNAARLAAQEFAPRVHVVDSHQVTMGLGYQALALAEAITQGANVDQALAEALQIRHQVRVVAMLDTLTYLHRGGRVSWARAGLGTLLKIKPFIEMQEGAVKRAGEVRTRRKGIEQLKQRIRALGPLRRLSILHTAAEAEARQILADLLLPLPEPAMIIFTTTVIGAHVGPKGLGFVALPEPA